MVKKESPRRNRKEKKDRARKEESRGRNCRNYRERRDRETHNEMDTKWTRKEQEKRKESLFKISAKSFLVVLKRPSVTQRLRRGNQVVRSLSYLCVGLPPRDADSFLLCVLLSPTPKAFQYVFFVCPQSGNSQLDYLLTL